jgi:TonB family protein
MTAGDLDLLFNPLRIVASTSTQVPIQVGRIEEIRSDKSSVVHVVNTLRSPCLQPVYPSQAKAAGIVGNVVMSVGVDKGYVEDVKVLQGHPLLIQSAIDAVRQRRYVPFVLLGETVPVKTTVVIPFGLK